MDSNSAWKLPAPKPALPLRWITSKKIGPNRFSVKICSKQSLLLIAVDKDAVLAHPLQVLPMTGHALVDQFVVRLDGVLQGHAAFAQALDGVEDVVGGQRQVLNALTVVLTDELLDLGSARPLLSFNGMRIARSGAIMAWLNRPVCLPSISKYFCSSKPNTWL